MNALTPLRAFTFEQAPPPSKDIGEPMRFAWVSVLDLVIDTSYQRPVLGSGKGNIRRIIEGFNWSLFSPLIVCERPDCRYAVIDGQHRAIAAVTHGGIEKLPCMIISGDLADEARAFAIINGQVTSVLPTQIYYARLQAGEERALQMAAVMDAAGVFVLKTPRPPTQMRPGDTMGISGIEDCIGKFGAKPVIAALRIVTKTGDGNPGYLRSPLIYGGSELFYRFPGWTIDDSLLLAAVGKIGIKALYAQVKKKQADSGGTLRARYTEALQQALLRALGPADERSLRAVKQKNKQPFRRFTEVKELDPENVRGLADDHPAIVGARTLFPTTVVDPKDSPALLVSGAHSRKLGDRVTKGPWAGFPIFQLSLEERATCPASCFHWNTCYGNGMQLARRHRHGPDLQPLLWVELGKLQKDKPGGFVVRLHVLGDFYSVAYVKFWAKALIDFPALHVFGYTAWPRSSDIGMAIAELTGKRWDRFAIRFSSEIAQPQGATTIWRVPKEDLVEEGIVCPAQTGKTDCCGTCGLCWSASAKDKSIAFIAHGPKFAGRSPAPAPIQFKPADPAPAVSAPAKLPPSNSSVVVPMKRRAAVTPPSAPKRQMPIGRQTPTPAVTAVAHVGDPVGGRSAFDRKKPSRSWTSSATSIARGIRFAPTRAACSS